MTNANNEKSKKRVNWVVSIIGLLIVVLLTWLTVGRLSNCGYGLGEWKKTLNYAFINEEEIEKGRKNIPSDYLTWYKKRKMNESWAVKKFANPPSYYTYEKIVERKIEEKKAEFKSEAKKTENNPFGRLGEAVWEMAGEAGGEFAKWASKNNIPAEKRGKVNYVAYAHEVYFISGVSIILGSLVFLIVFSICFRIIVRIINLFRKEPIVVK